MRNVVARLHATFTRNMSTLQEQARQLKGLIISRYGSQKAFADASGLTTAKISRAVNPAETTEARFQEVATKFQELQGSGSVIPDPIPPDAAIVIRHPETGKIWVSAKMTFEVRVHNPVDVVRGDIGTNFDTDTLGM